jgi:hypothetical protein
VDLCWLRATVCRFSTGPTHACRRALAETELAGIAPPALRARAAAITGSMPTSGVPAAALAATLGATVAVSDSVSTLASHYQPGTGDPAGAPAADAAVRVLVDAFGGVPDEPTAARIALLVQAHAATGALVAGAVRAIARWRPAATVPAVLAETLRHDPPVRALRRLCVADSRGIRAGTPVVLDIAAANRDPAVFADPDTFLPGRPDAHLTFGAGLRPCPGRDQAFALATGILETLLANGGAPPYDAGQAAGAGRAGHAGLAGGAGHAPGAARRAVGAGSAAGAGLVAREDGGGHG